MEKLDITAGSSEDILKENLETLKQVFPDAFTEGKLDFEVLRQLLGDSVDDKEEKYGLNWHGKRRARQIALTPSTGTLRPCPDESVDWETTKNLMIEGDNLEVLKLLQKSYAGKVKMIYIDPPYNTGKDFVYKDDFRDNIRNYLEVTGQVEGGAKISTNPESSGRYHTDWLNMMYPRLKLARNLLRDDGVIFISIDDNELSSLRMICDEIYGEENFIANIVWERSFSPVNLKKHFSESHEYVLCYSKNIDNLSCYGLSRSESSDTRYSNPDNDPRGQWTSSDMTVGPIVYEKLYEVTTPSGNVITPTSGRCWLFTKERLEEMIKDNRIWFGKNGNNVPRVKKFLSEVKEGVTPMTLWKHTEVGHSQSAAQKLKELFSGYDYFDYPKSIPLITRIIGLYSNDKDIVMDFFVGSATTAHSVIQQNADDGGQRRYMMVQLPEPTDEKSEAFKAGFKTIAEIAKERIRRAGKKIREENPLFKGDTGFRVFKLDSSNIKAWDPDAKDVESSIFDSIDHIKEERSENDVLYELLLKLGLDLTVPIKERDIVGHSVHSIGAGVLFVCLSKTITKENIEPLTEGLVNWHKELAPETEPTIVFRDSAFEDDVAKTNLTAILRQNGLGNIRSL